MDDGFVVCKYCKSYKVNRAGFNQLTKHAKQKYYCRSCRRKFVVELGEKSEDNAPLPIYDTETPLSDEVIKVVFGIEKKEPPPALPVTYPQNWESYNQAQVQEKLLLLDLLNNLCSFIPDGLEPKPGRPKMPLPQMVFCCVSKVYEQLSSRRHSSDLEIARTRGYLAHVPHFNTTLKYFNEPELTPILTALIRLSAQPLSGLETTFAVDASGLSSAFYSRWLDYRFGQDTRVKDWLKVHLICGTKTNIVTHVVVTDGKSNDSPHFSELVRETAKNFTIAEVYADKGYSSRENARIVEEVGGQPFIPFKSNSSGKKMGVGAWRRMYHYFKMHEEDFKAHYHQRSNVEATFSMLKRKFQGKLMLKGEVGQTNEALAKVLCHNLCVLIHEIFDTGIGTDFQEFAHLFPALHTNSVISNEKA